MRACDGRVERRDARTAGLDGVAGPNEVVDRFQVGRRDAAGARSPSTVAPLLRVGDCAFV